MRERGSLEADVVYQMVKKSFPQDIAYVFDDHMNSQYDAYEYVYVLQELSGLLYDIGFAIVSGGIVHKLFSDKHQVSKEDVERLVEKYEDTIEKLRVKLEELESKSMGITVCDDESRKSDFSDFAVICDETLSECEFHESMARSLRENSPEVVFEVNKALAELNKLRES